MKKLFDKLTLQEFLMALVGRVFIAMAIAIFFALVTELMIVISLSGDEADAADIANLIAYPGPMNAFFRGLLLAIPMYLSSVAVRKLPALWQFLLASAGLCAMAWLLCGNVMGAVILAVVCILRGRRRMDEAVGRSAMDIPSYPGLLAFAVAFAATAAYGLRITQRLSVICAVLGFLCCLAYRGLDRITGYITLNKGMSNLPSRRIRRTGGVAVAAAAVIAALTLLPLAVNFAGDFTIDVSRKHNSSTATINTELEDLYMDYFEQSPFPEGVEEEEYFQIPEWVSYIFYAIIGVLLLAMLIAAIHSLVKNFRLSYREEQDEVRSLSHNDEKKKSPGAEEKRKSLSLWDRSPNAQVRRRYQKTVKKSGGKLPDRWQTPMEIEREAGLTVPNLHRLYEKARYGQVSCTPEEVRSLKEKA